MQPIILIIIIAAVINLALILLFYWKLFRIARALDILLTQIHAQNGMLNFIARAIGEHWNIPPGK